MPGLSPTTGKKPVMAYCLSNFQNRKCPLTRSPLVYRVQKFTGVLARTLQIWCDVYPEETMHNIRLISEITGETFCVCVDPLWVWAHPPDDLRRGHKKTAPIRRKSPGPLWRGGRWSEERHEKTAPIRCESPGPPWRGGWWSEERTQEDSANKTRVPWSTVKGWTMTWGEDARRQCQSDASPQSPDPPWRGGQWPEERTQCHSDASPLVHREVVDDNLRRLRTLHQEQKNADEVSTNNYSWVVKLSMQTVSVTQNWPLLN